MKIEYELEDAGWAVAKITTETQTVTMTGFLSSTTALANLPDAAIRDRNYGTNKAVVVFLDEPGEHQLILQKASRGTVDVFVHWYEDWHSWGLGKPEPLELVLRNGRCNPRVSEKHPANFRGDFDKARPARIQRKMGQTRVPLGTIQATKKLIAPLTVRRQKPARLSSWQCLPRLILSGRRTIPRNRRAFRAQGFPRGFRREG